MSPRAHRMLLRAAVALAGAVPVGGGLVGVLLGPAMLQTPSLVPEAALDSHYRFLSGLLLAIGLGFWSTLRRIETQGSRFRLLAAVVMAGGLARLLGLLVSGWPGAGMLLGLGMELVVTPLLCLWQWTVARISAAEDA